MAIEKEKIEELVNEFGNNSNNTHSVNYQFNTPNWKIIDKKK